MLERVRSYEIGAVDSARIGDAVVTVGNIYTLPAYSPVQRYEVPSAGLTKPKDLRPNQQWKVTGRASREGGYILSHPEFQLGLHIGPDGYVDWGWVNANGRKVSQGTWKRNVLFAPNGEVATDGFKAELLYNGKSGSVISLTYREFQGDLIRPAFRQNLSYDLSQSRTISYKSIEMRVVRATNSQILFEVLADGGLEWLPRQ
jgi:hypothetical protein